MFDCRARCLTIPMSKQSQNEKAKEGFSHMINMIIDVVRFLTPSNKKFDKIFVRNNRMNSFVCKHDMYRLCRIRSHLFDIVRYVFSVRVERVMLDSPCDLFVECYH
jgi:hypothetical protein